MTRDSKHRILFVPTALCFGGAEMMLYKLLSRIDRDVFDPMVISLVGSEAFCKKIQDLDIPVEILNMQKNLTALMSMARLVRKTRKFKPDLIQGWLYHGNLAAQALSATLNNKVPVLWSIHHSIYNLADEKKNTALAIRIGAKCSKKPRKIHFVAETSAKQHEEFGYDSDKTWVVPNGFDTDEFAFSREARIRCREEWQIDDSIPVIGHLGRYHPVKGHAVFLQAASILVKTHEKVQFVMVGNNVDDANDELTGLRKQLGLERNVRFLGLRDDVPHILSGLDWLANSSSGESFPLTVGEAMSAEIPCVVTDVGDSAFLVGDTGKVVPPNDPAQLASAWAEDLNQGPGYHDRQKKAARNRIVENFSLRKFVDTFHFVYKSLI